MSAAPDDRNVAGNSWRSTLSFSALISELGLLNMNLAGRNYTWSNGQQSPHLARLDRFLISNDWNTKFPNSIQRAIPNSSSDHCPLTLTANTGFKRSKFFRFENFWLRLPALQEIVTASWTATPTAQTPTQLHHKFTNLQQQIKRWANEQIGTIKKQILTCRDFMSWIDKAKELRQLTRLERLILAVIKQRHSYIAVLEEDIWRQRARTKWELHGDRGTKYFHAVASKSKRCNAITQ